MKVLIMEDEVQIREGLKSEISWEKYGIQEIYTAQNGETGLQMARKIHPEIIISDIRMPKLDGIAAVKKLKEILPNCSIIFISAYPEKNYFKEAIRLKAVSFVEKPIDMNELDHVLMEAAGEQWKYIHTQKQLQIADEFYCQQLVSRLSRKQFESKEECRKCLEDAGISGDTYSFFASLIVFHRKTGSMEDYQWNQFCVKMIKLSKDALVTMLAGQNHSQQMVCHVFMKKEEQYERVISWIMDQISQVPKCNLLVGSLQKSFMKLHESYNDATLLSNRAFYCSYGEAVYGDSDDIIVTIDWAIWKKEFSEYLAGSNLESVLKLLEKYKESILQSKKMHYMRVQELYLYMFGELNRYVEQKSIIMSDDSNRHIQDVFLKNGNYEELHGFVVDMVKKILEVSSCTEDAFIVHIKKYIMSNYQNPWLSIKEIADSVGKSVSYTCVAFKKETGITLNQYLTEVRLEASKVFLANPKNNIKIVAEKCGYADSSYYARAFKKYTGVRPSDYRNEG